MTHPVTLAIREARRAQGRTLADVGSAAGVTRAYVSTLELGKDNPIPRGVQGILDTLGLRLVVLPTGTTPVLPDQLFLPGSPKRQPALDHAAFKVAVPSGGFSNAALAGYAHARTSSRDLVLTPHAGSVAPGFMLSYAPHSMPEVLAHLDHVHGLSRPNCALSRVQVAPIVTHPDGSQEVVRAWAWVHNGGRGATRISEDDRRRDA